MCHSEQKVFFQSKLKTGIVRLSDVNIDQETYEEVRYNWIKYSKHTGSFSRVIPLFFFNFIIWFFKKILRVKNLSNRNKNSMKTKISLQHLEFKKNATYIFFPSF